MIKAILWDNDGVLVATEALFFQATRETLARVGMELSQAMFIDFSLVRGYGLVDYLKAAGLDTARWEDLRVERNNRYADLLTQTPTLIDGVRETLETLYGRYIMGVVTSSRRDHFEIIHRSTGLLEFFDFVITSNDCEQTKPHPEPYLKGLARAGADASTCVAIEDSARGLMAANRAGLHCLMIPHALSDPGRYRGDYRVLGTIREVPAALVTLDKKGL